MPNALAFDVERLFTIQVRDLLGKLTLSIINQGFEFTEALEETLRESPKLGKHTNVLHFTSHDVAKYLWCHSEYQPWGHALSLQCSQCGATRSWVPVFSNVNRGYSVSCVAKDCGRQQRAERNGFDVKRPDGKFITVTKKSGWMKIVAE